jgi:hypothetical protein
VASSIVAAASHKLEKKQPLNGLRSILLVYPNDSAPVYDYGIPAQLAAPQLAQVPAGDFEEIWVARGPKAWRVL